MGAIIHSVFRPNPPKSPASFDNFWISPWDVLPTVTVMHSSPSSPSSSSSPPVSIPSTPFPGPYDLPASLSDALPSVLCSGRVFVSEQYLLPPPGLKVSHVPQLLAFPLPSSQADQLISLFQHASSSDRALEQRVRIPEKKLTFQNDAWEDALHTLVNHACAILGPELRGLRYDLDSLVLQRLGDCVSYCVDNDNTSQMFATLTVQLPSHFKGSEVIFREKREEMVFPNGADDGTNCFQYFFTAAYAHVDREMRPILEGCRATLHYNLL